MTVELMEYLPFGASVREKLEAYSMPVTETGCWLWVAGDGQDGYGCMNIDRKTTAAHRASYEEYIGPIPDGLCVLHRCDTPCCVNPDHLFLGTVIDNNLDRDRKGRASRGQDHPRAVLTDAQVKNLAADLRSRDLSQKTIAHRYGIDPVSVSGINLGKTWAHITGASDAAPIRPKYAKHSD